MGLFDNPLRKKIKEQEEKYKKEKEQYGESESGRKFREMSEAAFGEKEDPEEKKKRKGYFDKLISGLKGK